MTIPTPRGRLTKAPQAEVTLPRTERITRVEFHERLEFGQGMDRVVVVVEHEG